MHSGLLLVPRVLDVTEPKPRRTGLQSALNFRIREA